MRWLGDGVKWLVLGAVGATSACSTRAIPGDTGNDDGDERGDDDDDDGSANDDGTDESTSTSVGTSVTVSTTDATITNPSTDPSTDPSDTDTPLTCKPPEQWGQYQFCVGTPADLSGQCLCDEECQATTMAAYYADDCCDSCSYVFGGTLCSELVGGECCFVTYIVEDICGKGRPFLIEGAPRVATITGHGQWSAVETLAPDTTAIADELRARLAVHWLGTARAEHASIASFARFSMQLLALGAPPELLIEAQRATLDEIEHARLAYALASAYRGGPLGPGPLDVTGGLADVGDREAILRSLMREGCVDETIAATEAAVAAARATDPTVRRVLTTIADDEARHAALAWRTARWMLQAWPELADVAREVAIEACARREIAVDLDDEGCPAHGVLGNRELLQVARECIARTIRPALAAIA